MSEKAEPVWIRQLHLAEALAIDVRNSVVLRQTFVDERVIRVHQFERAAVIAQDVGEQHLRLAAETLADVVVEVREHQQVRRYLCLEVAKLQPLAGEVADESLGAAVRDHSLHLSGEDARLTK